MNENSETRDNEQGRHLPKNKFSESVTDRSDTKEGIGVNHKVSDDAEKAIDVTEELEEIKSNYSQTIEKDMPELSKNIPKTEEKFDLMDDSENIIELTEVVSDFSAQDIEVIESAKEALDPESVLPEAEILELAEESVEGKPEEQEIIDLIEEVSESTNDVHSIETTDARENLNSKCFQENKEKSDFLVSDAGEEEKIRHEQNDKPFWGSGLEKTFEFEEALSRDGREINEDDPAYCLGIEFEEDISEGQKVNDQFLKTCIPKGISAKTKQVEYSDELPPEEKKYITLFFNNIETEDSYSDKKQLPYTMESVKLPEDVMDAALERVIQKMFSEKIEHMIKEAVRRAIPEDIHEIKKLLSENEKK